ncbi:unnamed protein product [Caenorhabditis sp. 36 PRJEB53466]|nr:unnamed protein product [Caenorhabditis sp. 36 PRJEB53466]
MHPRFGVNNNYPINIILMQPTTSHETFLQGSDYVDFEAPSKLRNWPIAVDDKVFFVDQAIFSRNSDYFRTMMENKSFLEGAIGLLRIHDETPDDIHTLITVISPNCLGLYPDAIDEENVCTVLRLCDKFLMANLKQNCIDFLQDYRPQSKSVCDVFSLFYKLCFSLNAEYDHDEILESLAVQAMFVCLDELVTPSKILEFSNLLTRLQTEKGLKDRKNVKRVADAVHPGGALFRHRISFNEEVQGLGCHQCSMRPPARQSRSKNRKPFILSLCRSCGREVCVQCRRKLCRRLFEEWINELRSIPRREEDHVEAAIKVTVPLAESLQTFLLRVLQTSRALFLRTFGLPFSRYLSFLLRIDLRMSSNGYGSSHGEHVRSASHAGSWYNSNPRDLDRQLTKWLDNAGDRIGTARALISPHAGYSYCGETAAYAFKQIVPHTVERIFILGPSHVVALNGCAITTCSKYHTPLGDLTVDHKINEELRATRHFDLMDRHDEEAEHSIEMQLPFLVKVMGNRRYTIVPVLVGSLPGSRQQTYGNVFAHYMEDPKNLFVISSDFCHWGDRFSFSPYDRHSNVPIYEQITSMDRQGMNAIETLNPTIFNDYLKKTQNTICGRNPISIMLQAAEHFRLTNNHTHEFQFLHYTQSNKARSPGDSSVSYAAGVLFVHPNN